MTSPSSQGVFRPVHENGIAEPGHVHVVMPMLSSGEYKGSALDGRILDRQSRLGQRVGFNRIDALPDRAALTGALRTEMVPID
jgi:hypothetical protein